MRHTFEIGQYRIEFTDGARWPWTHFKISKGHWHGPWSKHIVWGKLSFHIDRPDVDQIQVCPHCSGDVSHLGEDGIDYCREGCGCIEGDKATYMTVRESEARS
jgi:hypothetical protein